MWDYPTYLPTADRVRLRHAQAPVAKFLDVSAPQETDVAIDLHACDPAVHLRLDTWPS